MIANIIIIIGVVLIIGAFVLVKNNNTSSLYSVVLTIIGLLFAIYPFLPFKTSSITSIQFKYENVEMYVGQLLIIQSQEYVLT